MSKILFLILLYAVGYSLALGALVLVTGAPRPPCEYCVAHWGEYLFVAIFLAPVPTLAIAVLIALLAPKKWCLYGR